MSIVALYRIMREYRIDTRLGCLRRAILLDHYAWLRAANEQHGVIYREDWTR